MLGQFRWKKKEIERMPIPDSGPWHERRTPTVTGGLEERLRSRIRIGLG